MESDQCNDDVFKQPRAEYSPAVPDSAQVEPAVETLSASVDALVHEQHADATA